jgi:hypothetical protein
LECRVTLAALAQPGARSAIASWLLDENLLAAQAVLAGIYFNIEFE